MKARINVALFVLVCSPANTNIEIDGQVPGVISTPEFPDGYPGSSCIWIIQAPDNFRLQITIEVLRLQGADDHLVIRDGASQFTPLVGKYGPCASGSVILFSSGSSAFLQTVSDIFSSADELRIAYRTIDPGRSCIKLFLQVTLLVKPAINPGFRRMK